MTARRRGPGVAVAAVLLAALLGACSAGVYTETPVPAATGTATAAPDPNAVGHRDDAGGL